MRLLVISEYAIEEGSGYTTIAHGLLGELAHRQHEIVFVAFSYKGTEHSLAASIIPTDEQLFKRQIDMTCALYKPDAIVVIIDMQIHLGMRFLQGQGAPYIGIFPIEADPLIHPTEATNMLDTMEGCLCESRFGTQMINDVGIRATYFPVGIDRFWRPPTEEERQAARAARNVEDRFVVLTVADNHERKNLPTHFATMSLLLGNEIRWPVECGKSIKLPRRRAIPNAYYIVNTKIRPGKAVGYDTIDLVDQLRLGNDSMILEHDRDQGLSREDLRELYWTADAVLLLSKAEGLGLPVMEAQACGVVVVGTDCTGIRENAGEGRGFLVPPEYVHIDPYFNQLRRWADPLAAAETLSMVARAPKTAREVRAKALDYARTFTWHRAANVFEEVLHGACRAKEEGEGSAEGTPSPGG
jgi:glycosyltransferase involved in cell wall biosynthesis